MPKPKFSRDLRAVAKAFHRTPEEVRQIILEEAALYALVEARTSEQIYISGNYGYHEIRTGMTDEEVLEQMGVTNRATEETAIPGTANPSPQGNGAELSHPPEAQRAARFTGSSLQASPGAPEVSLTCIEPGCGNVADSQEEARGHDIDVHLPQRLEAMETRLRETRLLGSKGQVRA